MTDVIVPCNGCTLCCQWGYRAEMLCPDPSLTWKDNGDCEHLSEHGCLIYEERPQACRVGDCREDVLPYFEHDPVFKIACRAKEIKE